eukprot:5465521-Amphidinium_carterae.1
MSANSADTAHLKALSKAALLVVGPTAAGFPIKSKPAALTGKALLCWPFAFEPEATGNDTGILVRSLSENVWRQSSTMYSSIRHITFGVTRQVVQRQQAQQLARISKPHRHPPPRTRRQNVILRQAKQQTPEMLHMSPCLLLTTDSSQYVSYLLQVHAVLILRRGIRCCHCSNRPTRLKSVAGNDFGMRYDNRAFDQAHATKTNQLQ